MWRPASRPATGCSACTPCSPVHWLSTSAMRDCENVRSDAWNGPERCCDHSLECDASFRVG
eukprot:8221593-Prorocentrum_lima.AAC.1